MPTTHVPLDRLLRAFIHVELETDRRDVVDYSIVRLGANKKADEGTRTLDLLHGKQTL